MRIHQWPELDPGLKTQFEITNYLKGPLISNLDPSQIGWQQGKDIRIIFHINHAMFIYQASMRISSFLFLTQENSTLVTVLILWSGLFPVVLPPGTFRLRLCKLCKS